LEGERVVASTPAVAVAVELEQHLLVAPEVELMAWYLMPVPAARRRSAMRVQRLGADGEAAHRAVVFEGQHLTAVMEAAAQVVCSVEEVAQLAVLKHCSAAARTAEEAAQAVVLEHCFAAARLVVEEEAAQLAAPKRCLEVARTAVEVAARHDWPAVAAEEAASRAEGFAQAVVVL
jgi:hypothetical protein